MTRSRVASWIWAVLLIAAALRFLVAWQPVEVLLKINLLDDAYYYFVIARNILNGDGVTLDGIHVNNGFHPLWLVLILPLFLLERVERDLPVHLALSFGAVLDVTTCYILFRIAERLTHKKWAGLVCAFSYAINSFSLLQATNGLETSLASALAAGCWLGVLGLSERPSLWRSVGWGILVGLALLARTDNVFLAIALGIYLLLVQRNRRGWTAAVLAAGVCAVVVCPWLIWNQVTFGTPMQVSGVAVPYAAHARHRMVHDDDVGMWIRSAVGHLFDGTLWLRGDFTGSPPFVGIVLWLAAAGALWVVWKRGGRSVVGGWLPVVLAGLTLVLIHTLWRWYPRPWYFMLSAQALAVGLGIGIVEVVEATEHFWRLAVVAAGVTLALLSVVTGVLVWQMGFYPWQDRMLDAAGWIQRNVPEDQRVGSLNAGIYAYYSDRVVINLDGVVNPDAFAAIHERRLMPYMQEVDIRYFVDFDHALDKEYGVFMGEGYPEKLEYIEDASTSPYPILGTLRAYRLNP